MTLTTKEFCRLIEIGVSAEGGKVPGVEIGKRIANLVREIAERNDQEFQEEVLKYRARRNNA